MAGLRPETAAAVAAETDVEEGEAEGATVCVGAVDADADVDVDVDVDVEEVVGLCAGLGFACAPPSRELMTVVMLKLKFIVRSPGHRQWIH